MNAGRDGSILAYRRCGSATATGDAIYLSFAQSASSFSGFRFAPERPFIYGFMIANAMGSAIIRT
jgi:hypothetical protein